MNKLRKQIICFAITAAALGGAIGAHASLPTGVNVLVNPGFEDATLDPWIVTKAGTALSISTNAQTGSQSVQVDFAGGADGFGIYQGFALDAGDRLQEYTITASVNSDGHTGGTGVIGYRLGIWEFGGGQTLNSSDWTWVSAGSSNWVDISFTVTLSRAAATSLRAVVQIAPQGSPKPAGHYLVDNISIKKNLPPTELPLGVNVLDNPGFEDATIAPWAAQNSAPLVSISTNAQTGLQSAQVDFTGDFHGIEQTISLLGNDLLATYTLTCSVNTDGYTDPLIVRLGLWENTLHNSAWVNVPAGSSGWVDLSYTVTLTDAAANSLRSVVQIAPQGSPKLPGHFLVDDVSLIKAIPATPFPTIYTNLITTVTTSAETPMHLDVRRPMAAGYYDATAEKTFISFAGGGMEPYVAAYDHTAGAWGSPVQVNVPDSSTDFHDYSHIFPSADGRVQVTYARHNTSLWIASSENPGSIDGTWDVREIGNNLGATYPMPMTSTDGSISILYRETKSPSDYRPMNLVRSTDNGATWSAPTPAIDYNNSRSDRLNEIYMGAMSYEADHPSAALGEGYNGTWTLAGGGDHDDYHKNMYYAFFQMSDQHWYAADGTDLGTNITDTEAEAHAKVFDSGALVGNKELGQTQDIGYTSKAVLNSDGNPVVVFQNGKTGNLDIGIWDGTQWSVTTPTALVGQKNDLRDLARVGDEVWLLEKMVGGTRVLQLMDDGQWETIAEFNPPTYSPDNYFIDNAQPEVFILAVDDSLGEGGGVYSVDVDVSLTVPVVAGDLDKDGFVTMNDVDLANSYLDGTIDGGDDAVTRQDAEIANGNTAAEALALLNLIDFDIDGDDTFDAADVTALEALVEPLMLGTAGMDGSGNFEVDVSGLTPGTTHYLKRSTDLVNFDTTVDTLTPASAAATMTDTNPPAGAAFYKVTD